MRTLIAIDPGGVHVGVSEWVDTPEAWHCLRSREMTPDGWADWLADRLGQGDAQDITVTYEIFRLAAGPTLMTQVGSTFPTVECIGQTRLLCRWRDVTFEGTDRSYRASARKRGDVLRYKWRAHGHGDHAKDAEATAIAYLKLDAEAIKHASTLPAA